MTQSKIKVSALLHGVLRLESKMGEGCLSIFSKYHYASFIKRETTFPKRPLSFRVTKKVAISIGFYRSRVISLHLVKGLWRRPFCFLGVFARVFDAKVQRRNSCSCRSFVFSFTMFPLAKNALSRLRGEQKLWANNFQSPFIHLSSWSLMPFPSSLIPTL